MQALHQTLISTGYDYFELEGNKLTGDYRGRKIWICMDEESEIYTVSVLESDGVRDAIAMNDLEVGKILYTIEKEVERHLDKHRFDCDALMVVMVVIAMTMLGFLAGLIVGQKMHCCP